MPVEKVLSRLTSTDDVNYFLLTSLHDGGEGGFDLAVVSEGQAWVGSVSESEIEKFSDKLKMDYDDYVTQTRKALTRQNIGAIQFQYTMKERDDDSLSFTWKKHMTKDDVKIQLGTMALKLKPSASRVVTAVLEHALTATTDLQTQILALQADKERLMAERTSALKRLEKCVVAKEEMERDMYSKFAVVVNDKKAKIRSLRDQQDGTSSASASASNSLGAGEGTSSGRKAKREIPGDETDELSLHNTDSENEYVTDEEKPGPSSKKPRISQPTKSKPLSDEDELMLDDGSGPTTPAAPRRRRRQDASKKQTPSRPVIPKVTSRDSTPRRGGRRASLGKSSSNTSSRSNQSADLDNLIDEM